MKFKKFSNCLLRAFYFRKHFAFQRSDDCFAGGLTPPASRCGVLKHCVEVVHSYQPEFFMTAFHYWLKRAACSADGTISDDDRFPAHGILYLMMISNKPDGISFHDAIVLDTHCDTAVIERVFRFGFERK